ncbi:MAG: PIG-L deacetylase family protein [Pseudomonadota bacterium]
MMMGNNQSMFLRFRKAAYRVLAFAGIRPSMRLLLHLVQNNPVPALAAVPLAERVLVLAPHMDDETIGCGGAIRAHVLAGQEVHVAFVTDGSGGFPAEDQARLTVPARTEIRRKEAAEACSVLGVSRMHCLNLPDGRSRADGEAVNTLLQLLTELSPEVVYLPFITDTHYDHATTNRLFLEAVERRPSELGDILCSCYEVWTPLHPNCIVDITEYMDTKLLALACYKSQLAMNNYLDSVKGLNAYRAIANQSRGFAEAFFRISAREYLSIARQA